MGLFDVSDNIPFYLERFINFIVAYIHVVVKNIIIFSIVVNFTYVKQSYNIC